MEAGWLLRAFLNVTWDDPSDPSYGDMTVIAVPLTFTFSDADRGRISLETDTNHYLETVGLPSFPACSELEFRPNNVYIQDPNGSRFASIGAGTRPKGTP